jgi:hypothetical protein
MLAEYCLSLETQVLTNSCIAGNSLSPNIGNPFPWTVIAPVLRCTLITKSFCFFESISSIEQYKSGARMNSFQTDKKR